MDETMSLIIILCVKASFCGSRLEAGLMFENHTTSNENGTAELPDQVL